MTGRWRLVEWHVSGKQPGLKSMVEGIVGAKDADVKSKKKLLAVDCWLGCMYPVLKTVA